MKPIWDRKLLLTTSVFLVVGLVGCGADESAPKLEPDAAQTSSSAPVEETATFPSAPEIEPERGIVETHPIGSHVRLPSADITVRTIEERDEIDSFDPEMTSDFIAKEGRRLWFFEIEWTNNTDEAVSKECHGPDMFDLRVFDINGVEMLMVDQPGMIEGQNCSTGLLKGETGTWMSAFTGLDADFGWAVFEDYAGDQQVVTLDPDLELAIE